MASEHTVGFEPADELAKDRESVRRRFWIKLKRVAGRLPFAEELLAAYYCAFDRQTPRHVQAALLGAIAYFIIPFDFVTDVLPVLGFTDDAAVLATAIRGQGKEGGRGRRRPTRKGRPGTGSPDIAQAGAPRRASRNRREEHRTGREASRRGVEWDAVRPNDRQQPHR